MNSLNPLFLDSTKPVGDKFVTNVELTVHAAAAAESVFYFEFIDENDSYQKIQLQKIITKKKIKFNTDIWVKTDRPVQCRWIQHSSETGYLYSPWVSEVPVNNQLLKELMDLSFKKEDSFHKKSSPKTSNSIKTKSSNFTSQLNFESLKSIVNEFNKDEI